MGGPTFGQRFVAALIPRYFKDLTALQLASGHAYSTVHDWKTGKADPRFELASRIAAKVGADLLDLLRGEADASEARPVFRSLPGWAAAEAEARARYALPKVAWYAAGETAGALVPEALTPEFVRDLAIFWWTHASADELERADMELTRREIEALERAHAAKLRAVPTAVPAPEPPAPRRPGRRK